VHSSCAGVPYRPLVERAGDFAPADSHRAMKACERGRRASEKIPAKVGIFFFNRGNGPRRPRGNPLAKFWRLLRRWDGTRRSALPLRSWRTRGQTAAGPGRDTLFHREQLGETGRHSYDGRGRDRDGDSTLVGQTLSTTGTGGGTGQVVPPSVCRRIGLSARDSAKPNRREG